MVTDEVILIQTYLLLPSQSPGTLRKYWFCINQLMPLDSSSESKAHYYSTGKHYKQMGDSLPIN